MTEVLSKEVDASGSSSSVMVKKEEKDANSSIALTGACDCQADAAKCSHRVFRFFRGGRGKTFISLLLKCFKQKRPDEPSLTLALNMSSEHIIKHY